MRVMVTGGRGFADYSLAAATLGRYLSTADTLVHGACRGCDEICARIAQETGIVTEPHPAQWDRYGKAAGPIRNREMIDSGIDLVIVFPGGRGTANAERLARERGIRVIRAVEEQEKR